MGLKMVPWASIRFLFKSGDRYNGGENNHAIKDTGGIGCGYATGFGSDYSRCSVGPGFGNDYKGCGYGYGHGNDDGSGEGVGYGNCRGNIYSCGEIEPLRCSAGCGKITEWAHK